MPEGPELYLSGLFINRICKDLIFSGKVFRNPIHKCADVDWDQPSYSISAESKGKELKVHLRSCNDGMKKINLHHRTILFTFGMSGKFEFVPADNMPKHSHLIFYTKSEPSMGLAFVDYRRFGRWTEGGDWSVERGPCIIQEQRAFIKHVAESLNNSAFNKPICEVMLNQKYFNGIGNYLRAEILYRCKVPPFEKARSVLESKDKDEINQKKENDEKPSMAGLKSKLEDGSQHLKDGIKLEISEPKQQFKTESDCLKQEGFGGDIKEELIDPNTVELLSSKGLELLNLCHTVPLEVIDIGSTKYSLSELYHDEAEGKSFNAWLQCYYQDGMKNLADHNKRTMWFSGPAGLLVPKEQKSRGKKSKSKAKTDTEIKQKKSSKSMDKKTEIKYPKKLTRKQLEKLEIEAATTSKDSRKRISSKSKSVTIPEQDNLSHNEGRKRKGKETSSTKTTKKAKLHCESPASKRCTRTSLRKNGGKSRNG